MPDILGEIHRSWGWIGLVPSQIVAENEFGNLLIKDKGGRFWRLCPEEAYCKIVAETESQFEELLKDPEFTLDWQMAALVEAATREFGQLSSGRKFCLKIPGFLGGPYSLENIGTSPMMELIGFSGSLAHQTKDLPDGSHVELVVDNDTE